MGGHDDGGNAPRGSHMDHLKCFVGGIPPGWLDEDLLGAFRAFRPVSAEVMADKFTGKSRCFGFVRFETAEDKDDAIRARHRTVEWGREISVKDAAPKSSLPPRRFAARVGARSPYGGHGSTQPYGGAPPPPSGYGRADYRAPSFEPPILTGATAAARAGRPTGGGSPSGSTFESRAW